MSKIEELREDYREGDAIRISCTLGVKEGVIVAFSDSRIKIQPFVPGKKPISISADTILDWEEAEMPEGALPQAAAAPAQAPETPVQSAPTPSAQPHAAVSAMLSPQPVASHAVPVPTHAPEPETTPAPEITPDHTPAPAPAQAQDRAPVSEPERPSFVKGYVDLSKIDSAKGVREAIHRDDNKDGHVPQPQSTLDEDYADLIEKYNKDPENCQMVFATGYIKTAPAKNGYGFIWDQYLKADLIFFDKDIVDDDLYDFVPKKGVRVSYIKLKTAKGYRAISVILPRPVYEVLALADGWLENEDKESAQLANDVLQLVLYHYPNNEDAKALLSDITAKVVKRDMQYKLARLDSEAQPAPAQPVKKPDKALPAGWKSAESYKEYRSGKVLVDLRRQKDALQHYLKAFELEQNATLVKDICTQYYTLIGRKYLDTHPEEAANAEQYRSKGREFLEKNLDKLPLKEVTTLNFLVTTYSMFKDYEKLLEVIDRLIPLKRDAGIRNALLNRKAAALMALKRTAEAETVLQQVLAADTANLMANNLLEQIRSNRSDYDLDELFDNSDASDNQISQFLIDVVNNYNEYTGVPNWKILDENELYSDKTFNNITEKVEASKSDSQSRSNLLLTKIKLYLHKKGKYDKRDFARYCNDMARLAIIRNPNAVPWDVARFYFNESFSLMPGWDSSIRQFVIYLGTLIQNSERRERIFDTRRDEMEQRIDEDIYTYVTDQQTRVYEIDWLDGLLRPAMFNEAISNRIARVLYDNASLRGIFAKRLDKMGRAHVLDSREALLKVWKELRENRIADENALLNSYLAAAQRTKLQDLVVSSRSLIEPSRQSWLAVKDKERIRSTLRELADKVEKFINSQDYTSKEDIYRDASRLIESQATDIRQNPTKFSYDAILPLLERYRDLLDKEWNTIDSGSKPVVDIALLTEQICIKDDDTLDLQFAVSNDKSSAPISNISISLPEIPEIESWICREEAYIDYLKGGDQPVIFHVTLKLKDQYRDIKAFSVRVKCSFSTKKGENESVEKDLSVKLYSESDFKPFANPYNAGAPVTRREMFFGRDAFISNLVDVMHLSQTKQLIFYGQKRSGKSSVLHFLKEALLANNAFCVSFSLGVIAESLNSFTLFHQILSRIDIELATLRRRRRAGRYEGEVPDFHAPTLDEFCRENSANPVPTFARHMAAFKEACSYTPGWENRLLVVMIDEFTYIYSKLRAGNIEKTIMQQWKSAIENAESSFASVLVGQDVIPYFREEPYARNAFQMMEAYRLDYLEEPDARALVEVIGKERYAKGAVDLILQYTACSPYYIQTFCSALVEEMNKRKILIATIADVNDIADKLVATYIKGNFDCLISSLDLEDSNATSADAAVQIEDVTEDNTLAVLYRIARLTATSEYCSAVDILKFCVDDDERKHEIMRKVLNDLTLRSVVEIKEGLYRIKVKLFKKWLLNQESGLACL